MIVQHNLTAMNANRMLGITTSAQAKSTEKLSSGYKINRAADDAAGLAISEKMRRQIRGLTQASANAQDGISAVQTAEGALTEVHDMLQRMNELSIKAGNGTMSESDRQSVQDEIDQLITEIDRVSETTKFNETYLLKGEGKNANADEVSARVNGKIQDAVVTKAKGNIYSGIMDMAADTALDAGTEDVATITYLDGEGNKRTKDVTFKTGADAGATAQNIADAINADKDLKKIFKASYDNAGKLTMESKLDGTKTDGSKNKVTDIAFASAAEVVTGTAPATRLSKLKDVETLDAVGESYALKLGSVDAATGAPTIDLQDGESITINGKTYTYDANKSDSQANSFSTVEELQKLLGSDYDVSVTISGTKTTTIYERSDKGTPAAANDTNAATAVGSPVVGDFSTKMNDTGKGTAIGSLDATCFDTAPTSDGPVTNADVAAYNAADAATATKAANVYSDMTVTLNITAKASVDTASDVLNFSLQVGADTTEENKINVDIESMSAKSLGIDNVTVTGKDSTNADEAVNTIADAIAKVSKQRSALGAIQNRLEHTINNLDNVVENTTSAEAQIRDTDIATEMVRYSNNSILQQAGTSMLSQANQSNQLALSLLG